MEFQNGAHIGEDLVNILAVESLVLLKTFTELLKSTLAYCLLQSKTHIKQLQATNVLLLSAHDLIHCMPRALCLALGNLKV